MIRTQVFIVGLVTLAAGYAHAQSREPLAGQFFEDMMYLRNATSARQSSWDRTGGNMDMRSIDPGQTLEIFKEDGAGCIRHIYFTTIGPPTHFLRDGVIRMYWDGETEPSVEVPFGDLFGLDGVNAVRIEGVVNWQIAEIEGQHFVAGGSGICRFDGDHARKLAA